MILASITGADGIILGNLILLVENPCRKFDSLLQLTNWEIEEQFNKKENLTEGKTIQTFDIDLIKEAEHRNPAANKLVYEHVVKKKPVSTLMYNEKKDLVLAFEKPMQPPTILLPEASRESIPNAGCFYGRVCGIVNYIANPPPLYSNVVLQSVILALPIKY